MSEIEMERERLRAGLIKQHIGGPIIPEEEDEIMVALRVAGLDAKAIRAVTYTSWKDGIDIERPATALVAFARLIRSGLMRP